jgi:glycosyltransferase involved in cell wall biosynthesis
MHVGVDGRELAGQPTGVGRYLQRLLREWAGTATGHRFTVYSPDARTGLPAGLSGEVALVDGAGGTWWEQVALRRHVRRDRPDVFLAPGYTAPLWISVPTVVAIHDVSFAAHPEWFTWREGFRRRLLTRLAGAQAFRVLTISDFSRDQIVHRLGIARGAVQVIPLGVGLDARQEGTASREPLVLFVGTILNRRHLPLLLEGFSRLLETRPDAWLEIVGRNRTHPHQDIAATARAAGVESRVRVRDWVSDAELTDLYRRASAFAFLSEYEGFGLTPLEALSAGVPPVVLDTPVAREAYGDAAIRVTPRTDEVASALADALDPAGPRRTAVFAAAPDVLGRYSWRRTAADTLSVLDEASRR